MAAAIRFLEGGGECVIVGRMDEAMRPCATNPALTSWRRTDAHGPLRGFLQLSAVAKETPRSARRLSQGLGR